MTTPTGTAQMEKRLLELSEMYRSSHDIKIRREYILLHAKWMLAKGNA